MGNEVHIGMTTERAREALEALDSIDGVSVVNLEGQPVTFSLRALGLKPLREALFSTLYTETRSEVERLREALAARDAADAQKAAEDAAFAAEHSRVCMELNGLRLELEALRARSTGLAKVFAGGGGGRRDDRVSRPQARRAERRCAVKNRHRYPKDWPAIRAGILLRANNACEQCHAGNGECIARGEEGDAGTYMTERGDVFDATTGERLGLARGSEYEGRFVVVVLTVAHIDHNEQHNDPSNLRALCQRCHLAHDAADNARRRRENAAKRVGQGSLFDATEKP